MKILHIVVGLTQLVVGVLFLSITVSQEPFQTFILKALGGLILILGVVYLKKVAKLGRQ